jgi:hypothetical protein
VEPQSAAQIVPVLHAVFEPIAASLRGRAWTVFATPNSLGEVEVGSKLAPA